MPGDPQEEEADYTKLINYEFNCQFNHHLVAGLRSLGACFLGTFSSVINSSFFSSES